MAFRFAYYLNLIKVFMLIFCFVEIEHDFKKTNFLIRFSLDPLIFETSKEFCLIVTQRDLSPFVIWIFKSAPLPVKASFGDSSE